MEEVIFECGASQLGRKEGEHSPGTEDNTEEVWRHGGACMSLECCTLGDRRVVWSASGWENILKGRQVLMVTDSVFHSQGVGFPVEAEAAAESCHQNR